MAHSNILHRDDVITLPPLTSFLNPDLWKYGRYCGDDGGSCKYCDLGAALALFKDFHVVNALTQQHQRKICRLVDGSADADGWGILHYLAWAITDHSEVGRARLAQALLQMGAHPDFVSVGHADRVDGETWPDDHQYTPSHMCADDDQLGVAEALVVCRPNLKAKDGDGATPAALLARKQREVCWSCGGRSEEEDCEDCDEAARQKRASIANIFDEAEKYGFSSIAQLAEEKKWWAVHNLCRRGVVPELEKLALHNGKDAIGWAMHHKKFAIVEELEYLLKGLVQPKNEGFEDRLTTELKKSNAEKEAMKKKLDEQEEHLKQLKGDQALLKNEGEQLKEMLLVNLAKAKEDREGLKKELMAALEDNNLKWKNYFEGKKDQPSEHQKRRKIRGSIRVASQDDERNSISRQTACQVASEADSNVAEESEMTKDRKIAMLEAENKALKGKLDRQQEILTAQSALLGSSLKDV